MFIKWMFFILYFIFSVDCNCIVIVVIGNFGHCAQELMNLLLVGQATSNVFDGEMPLGDSGSGSSGGGSSADSESKGDSMMLRGVPNRANVGYLTQLEALRYCQVWFK